MVLSLCALVSIAATAAAQSLPLSRTSRVSPAQHVVALDPRWMLKLASAPAAAAGFDQQRAYVPLKDGTLVAVDLDSGEERWKIEMATAFAPETGDGFVFVAAGDAVVALIDRTGEAGWKTAVGGAIAAAPFFDAGSLVVSTAGGDVVALRAGDGGIIWRRTFDAPLAVSPAAAGERMFVALGSGDVLAIDAATGASRWTFAANGVPSGVLALDDQLVVGTRGNRVYSLRPASGRVRWTWQLGGDVVGPAIADDRHIYFTALDNVLRAVDRGSGNLRWTAPLPSRPSGGPLPTGDVVIVPTVSASIGAYLIETGKPSFSVKTASEESSIPFLREGVRATATRLVSVSRDGILQGFAPRHEPPLAPFDALPGATKTEPD